MIPTSTSIPRFYQILRINRGVQIGWNPTTKNGIISGGYGDGTAGLEFWNLGKRRQPVIVRTATDLIAAYMRACGFAGWASFWNAVYVLPGYEHDRKDDFILPTSACFATREGT